MSAQEIEAPGHLANNPQANMSAQEAKRQDSLVADRGLSPEELRSKIQSEGTGISEPRQQKEEAPSAAQKLQGMTKSAQGAVQEYVGKMTGNTQAMQEGRIAQERGSNLSKEENKNNHIKALPPYFIEIPPGARDMAFVETPIDEASPWIERTQTHQSYLSDSCPSRTKCIRLVLAGKMKRLVGVTVGSPLLKSRGYLQEQRGHL
ncbi:MAG: hypothetical protein DHS80DRAFT_32805 [Piptocephalis tieghemiana]|nr:MAG: hypothetical protein DHS80DRAFT_32805 [Piptocephalis tieghemiana]